MNSQYAHSALPAQPLPPDFIVGTSAIARRLGTYHMKAARWLRAGKIPGARRVGKRWVAPRTMLGAMPVLSDQQAPIRSFGPLCDELTAIRAAAGLVAFKSTSPWPHVVKFDAWRGVIVDEPGVLIDCRWEFDGCYGHATREDAMRRWVRFLTPAVAERHRTGEDLHAVLSCSRVRDREHIGAISEYISASDDERRAIKRLTERLIIENWPTVRALAHEIRFARDRIDTSHPFLAGVSYLANWQAAFDAPWR